MILFSAYADALKSFLDRKSQEKVVAKFRIYKRLGFRLDAYVFVAGSETEDDLKSAFLNSDEFKSVGAKEGQEIDLNFYVYPESRLDSPYFRAVKEGDNDIDPGPRFRFDSFLKQGVEQHTPKKDEPTVVTFYSYKGGMGRTTTVMAYAMHLADNLGKNVVVIDCDLEAPGYLNFFNLSENPELQSSEKNGFVEFFCDALFTNDLDIHNYVVDVDGWQNDEQQEIIDSGKKQGRIWVVPAGNLNETALGSRMSSAHRNAYLEGLAKLNLSDSQTVVGIFKLLFEKLNELDESAKPDAILIDSRTGFNDIFGNAVMNLSKSVVGFFGRSRQTAPGYMNLLQMHVNSEGKFNLHLAYSILPDGINEATSDMQAYMANLYADHDISIPDETPIHRVPALEFIGTGDQERDRTFRERIGSIGKKKKRNIEQKQDDDYRNFSDYVRLFEAIDSDVRDDDSYLRSLQDQDRIFVLQYLKKILDKITFSAEESSGDEPFVLRKCMAKIFDKDACLFYGVDGCGRTTLFQALANPIRSKKIIEVFSAFSKLPQESVTNYHFLNVKVSREELNVFVKWSNPEDCYNFWQICILNKLLNDDDNESLNSIRRKVRESRDSWKEQVRDFGRGLAEPYKRHVERDLFIFDQELKKQKACVIISFDVDDDLELSQYYRDAVSGLMEFWRLNREAFDFIWPKMFAGMSRRHDFEESCVNMNWNVQELFLFLYEMMIETDERILNLDVSNALDRLIEQSSGEEGRSVFDYLTARCNPVFSQKFSIAHLLRYSDENLEMIFFGEVVLDGNKKLGRPRNYFEKVFSGGTNEYVLLRPFIMMLKQVVSTMLNNGVNGGPVVVLPSALYATGQAARKIANQYCDYLMRKSHNGILRYLGAVAEGRNRMLGRKEFDDLIRELCLASEEKDAQVWEQILVQMGVVDCMEWRKYRDVEKNYYFAPIFWDLWNLREAGNDI